MSLPMKPLPELVSQLLEPISAESPCGQDLRYETEYDQLRELRREDDTSLPTGVWQSSIKRALWPDLERLATTLLLERSKDLMISAWLGEAWLHLAGLDGLPGSLALVAGLCERYPEHLHPLAEDGDQSWRVIPLEWLARRYSEVLLTRVPLLDGRDPAFAGFSLDDWQRLQRQQVQGNDSKNAKASAEAARNEQKKLSELIRSIPLSFWLHRQGSLMLSLQHLQRLEAWSDAYLGNLAPGYKSLQDVMQAMLTLVEEFIAMHPQQPAVVPAQTSPVAGAPMSQPTAAPAQVFQEPANREEAYRQLLVIAGYLARTEPHSPVPYLIRRGVEWGNKPLSELLGELISADAESRRLWTLLGVL
ncbi:MULTISPECIES: type VI secretion system protein TssA [Pseudomonas]|uniref:Type VI secretion protein n=1 Tax=Pseudomonas frederiksbergensis TaxID=104087 RepID=A0A0B1Z6S7_9PSED|nr:MULTISPECIES: type VI secretion system protein TssA [Pseudomonas]KHK64906.1 type VI secretion protein [Pseudomonas frederiksbergensis]KJH86669.1 type VI secretion protein [Pseudomonas fluorescens]WRV70486.1 type VI secretion system protein TssA [Pseudomonas frederiksbergensis]